jgi:two-component system phosphate regulon sensor histidine kinase PhoR
MKKKVIGIIVFLASVSLIGIVLTQGYWVKQSINLHNSQFDNSIRIAIKSVLNQLDENKNDSIFKQHLFELSCRKLKIDVTDVIVPATLDSLLHRELETMVPNNNYYYGIYNMLNGKYVAGNYAEMEDELNQSPYRFSLKTIYHYGNYYLNVYFPAKQNLIVQQLQIWLLLSVFFLVVLIISFIYVINTILKQKKLSELKSDFINNMTHEFKTPISTSMLAAEMIQKPEVLVDKRKVIKYANIILDENTRLQNQVEQVLQMSILEKGNYQLKFKKTNIHQLLQTVFKNFNPIFQENKIKATLRLKAEIYQVTADKVHIMNVFYNLIDNAIKYRSEKPEIQIKTWNNENGIVISFQDNGIGISPENQKNVFKNLYRVPTGNIQEVRGFGMGLFYAKTIVDAHNGNIDLKSELGHGSIFNIFLPFDFE